MKIGKPEIVHRKSEVIYSVDVESANFGQTLWFSLQSEFSDLLTDSSDASVMALLLPAMLQEEDIHITGTISERLWHNLSGPYQKLMKNLMPWLSCVRIHPETLSAARKSPIGVATGFSAGVDSYCTLLDYFYSDIPTSLRITHLLFNNVGSHGSGKPAALLFRERFAKIKPAADRTGLPLVMVDSNLDEFYPEQLNHPQTHTIRDASVALLLQGGIGRFMYSSSVNTKELFVGPSSEMCYTDLITLPLLSTEAIDMFSVGSEYTRVEKTLRIAQMPITYDTLNVCVRGNTGANCSTCLKCLRTLLTLEIAGLSNKFAASFDIDAYRQHRSQYMGYVLASKSHDPLQREIFELASARGFSFPVTSHLYAPPYYLFQHSSLIRYLYHHSSLIRRMVKDAAF